MLKILNRSSQAQANEIEKKTWKIKVWNQCPPKLEKFDFWSHFGLPKPSFFRHFGNKNEDDFLTKKPKQKQPHVDLPNPPQS